MIDFVQIVLNVFISLVLIGVIAYISFKKIVPIAIKRTFAGYKSGFARNQKAVKRELVKGMMDKTLIGPVLDGLGMSNMKQYLIRHPDATLTLVQWLEPYIMQFAEGLTKGEETPDISLSPPTAAAETGFLSPSIEKVKREIERLALTNKTSE